MESKKTGYGCGEQGRRISNEVREYVERVIVPKYDGFDKGHDRRHVEGVIAESLRLAEYYDVDINMVYIIAAYHDVGLCEGREVHEKVSAQMMRDDEQLRRWFSEEKIEVMAEAAEDHRASSKREPRSIYGKIVADADRQIEVGDIVRRTVAYGMDNYPELSEDGHWERAKQHLKEKYGEGGYLKLNLKESQEATGLGRLREVIRDDKKLRTEFDRYYKEYGQHEVRKARKDDIEEIMAMVEHSRRLMRESGNERQWVNGYPTREAIEKDIEQGNGYVVGKGKEAVAYFAFIIGEDPTYNIIEGGHWDDAGMEYGTIHRLAKKEGEKGVAKRCLEWCKGEIGYLRADTHEDNKTVQHLLERYGFEYRGVIYVADGSPRLAYQWRRREA